MLGPSAVILFGLLDKKILYYDFFTFEQFLTICILTLLLHMGTNYCIFFV